MVPKLYITLDGIGLNSLSTSAAFVSTGDGGAIKVFEQEYPLYTTGSLIEQAQSVWTNQNYQSTNQLMTTSTKLRLSSRLPLLYSLEYC